MTALSNRELHRRLRLVQDELAASLFFATPVAKKKGEKRPTIRELRYQLDERIKQTVSLIECIETGDFQENTCGACGRAFGDGAETVTTEDGPSFHATVKCWGSKPARGFIYKLETRAQRLAWRRRYVEKAKAYLKSRGRI